MSDNWLIKQACNGIVLKIFRAAGNLMKCSDCQSIVWIHIPMYSGSWFVRHRLFHYLSSLPFSVSSGLELKDSIIRQALSCLMQLQYNCLIGPFQESFQTSNLHPLQSTNPTPHKSGFSFKLQCPF